MRHLQKPLFTTAAMLSAILASSTPASACGGFFCAATQPVNQAAERIVFAENGNGTVTAIIQIQYEGPSENFSWLLPISSVPMGDEIAVASDLAFQRLQSATNPQYTLTTRVEGTCRSDGPVGAGGTSSGFPIGGAPGSAGGGGTGSGGGVMVEASGVVGAFEWTVISLSEDLPEPADAAIEWLEDNDYDVPTGAGALLGPYLADGMFLLALRLTKGSDTGSIRPIVLTYDATRPMIPVKLTAVAANEDMGVMTWVLGGARAVPQNYLSLELNEARINWFNAASNYNDVVTAAANEGDGRGFVTEFSGATSTLANAVWSAFDESVWETYRTGVYGSFQELFDASFAQWGAWDGYWDAVRTAITLPNGLAFEDFKLCPNCYSGEIEVMPAAFVSALEKNVIEPVRRVQTLIDGLPQVTRLYTTMSAEEMVVDPLFTFNPDLPDVDNIHTAERVIECNSAVYQFEATWRIELPQGGQVRGTGSTGTWPDAFGDLPSNLVIKRDGESGDGQILEDNAAAIQAMLDEYNARVPGVAAPNAGAGGNASGGGTGGSRPVGAGGTGPNGTGGNGNGGTSTTTGGTSSNNGGTVTEESPRSGNGSDSGCSVAGNHSRGFGAILLGLFLLGFRQSRRVRSLRLE
jgi:hypothetical protein